VTAYIDTLPSPNNVAVIRNIPPHRSEVEKKREEERREDADAAFVGL
jgi:hypothetical protein